MLRVRHHPHVSTGKADDANVPKAPAEEAAAVRRRLKITLEYNGAAFHGFQRQPGLPTVQGFLEAALGTLTGEPHDLQVAGRTDRGVHARAQVVHVDTCRPRHSHPLIRFKDGLNALTPAQIQLTEVAEVTTDFHARFSATARHYRFVLFNRRMPSPFYADFATHVRYSLDVPAMVAASRCLIGELDFSSFRTSECQSSTPMCAMQAITIQQPEAELITIDLTANHFLHNMVRIICGTLVDIGRGQLPADAMPHILQAKNRTAAGNTLAPNGLYFMGVDYAPHTVLARC